MAWFQSIVQISFHLLTVIALVDIILKYISRTDARKFSFARRVCPVWNRLPHEFVYATSISSFKHKLDTFNFDL